MVQNKFQLNLKHLNIQIMDPKTTLEQQDDFYLSRRPNNDDLGEEEDLVDDLSPNLPLKEQETNHKPWEIED